MGQVNAALLARDVVALFKPRKVLLVGIAGGLGKEICLGDIVVSDQVVDYEVGKVTTSGATPRWSVYRSDALLRERLLAHRDPSWIARVRTARPDGDKSARPTIRSGVVLSGNKVIADAKAAGALAAVWSRASAIEMEAAGIAAALHQSVDAPGFVMVKVICDRADASKDDSWQDYAADVAAAFVTSFVFGSLQPSDAIGQRDDTNVATADSGVDLRALRLALSAAFDLRELKILISDLGLDWDNIAGDIKDEKIVELLRYMNRRAGLDQLVALVRAERPGLLDAYSPAYLQEKSWAEKETLIATYPPVSTVQDVQHRQVLPDLTSGKATPAVETHHLAIREKAAAEIVANLKGISLSYQFHETVKELYLGRWTREPGWQVKVHDWPKKLPGGRWFGTFTEVGSGPLVMASTVQDLSALRLGDSVTVSGRISDVSPLEYIMLEDAIVRGDHVPFP
jgi:nucleoside phosphorylase